MRTQLLCTFTNVNDLNEIIDIIISCNTIMYDKIYVFQNEEDKNQLVCTYNVEYDDNFMEGIPDTISLHRKKNTNTLYTINALNTLIRKLNNGVLDKTFSIEWDEYKNCILLFDSENSIQRINTKLYKIIDIDNIENN